MTLNPPHNRNQIDIDLHDILAHLPGSLFWKNLDGVYLGSNDYAAQLAGFSCRTLLVGKTDYDLSWKAQADVLREHDLQVITTGVPLEVEETFLLTTGELAVYLVRKVPLVDKKGNIVGVMGTAVDIAYLKNRELELLKTKEKVEQEGKTAALYLNNIVASLPGSIYWKDVNGVYLGCNDFVAVRMAGLKGSEDVIGKTDFDFPWKNHAIEWRANDLEVMRTAERKVVEEVAVLADGSQIIELTSKAPLKDEAGNIIGVIGASLDITNRKRFEIQLQEAKENAERANQAKSNFLATVSHELRTPLNAILGMAQILGSKALPPEYHEYISAILVSGKNLLGLINDILDFSKLEAGKLNINAAACDLSQIVNEVALSMRHQVEGKGIQFNVRLGQDLPKSVMTDALRLRQVLVNLIGNAIKFTEKGQILITVDMLKSNGRKVWVRIVVADTGIGIPQDKLNYVFERFTQIDSTYGRRFAGAGLGLSICKQLIAAMDGKIGVESKLDEGSSFWFELPFKLANCPSSNAKKNRRAKQKIDSDIIVKPVDVRILLVEDNLLNQKVTQVMLEELGCYQLDIAAAGKDAISFFSNNKYDLVFMDIGLPDMDGLMVTTELRRLENGAGSRTPIIALTAHVLEEDRQKCFAVGVDDVLTKPLIQSQLKKIITHWLIKPKA